VDAQGRDLSRGSNYPCQKATRNRAKGSTHDKEEHCAGKDDEKLIADYERGAFRPVKNQDRAKQEAWKPLGVTPRKDARINIRLSTADLEMLKRRAPEEGLPYQSLIASILHKYVSRSAPQTN
jgi:predicted DNA binding CopG/RHH family protein